MTKEAASVAYAIRRSALHPRRIVAMPVGAAHDLGALGRRVRTTACHGSNGEGAEDHYCFSAEEAAQGLLVVMRHADARVGAQWLAERAALGHDETAEAIIAELPADRNYPDIVTNPMRYSGQLTFVGRRVSVATIAGMAASGERPEDLAAGYGLSMRQIHDAIDYAKKYRPVA